MIVVATFYKFTKLDDGQLWQARLEKFMKENNLLGTVIVALEGINGTIAGERAAVDGWKAELKTDARFDGIEYQESLTENFPFKRSRVLFKPEIVTMKKPQVDPTTIVGTYVSPKEWNQLLLDPEVLVLDVRNDFEVAMGSFKNALNPQTEFFSDFPHFVEENLSPKLHKKIAMSCTGGIRCEKASSLMKAMGFNEVFHLKGGVLKYLEDMPKEESLWQGECFVFDERRTVKP